MEVWRRTGKSSSIPQLSVAMPSCPASILDGARKPRRAIHTLEVFCGMLKPVVARANVREIALQVQEFNVGASLRMHGLNFPPLLTFAASRTYLRSAMLVASPKAQASCSQGAALGMLIMAFRRAFRTARGLHPVEGSKKIGRRVIRRSLIAAAPTLGLQTAKCL